MSREYLVSVAARDRGAAHIFDRFGRFGDTTALFAKCGARFLRPDSVSYWQPLGDRGVCGNCARIARREARELIALANGQP